MDVTDQTDPANPAPAEPTIAFLLDHLLNWTSRPDGSKWTMSQVAKQMTERGIPTTLAYISQLRQGTRTNPTASYLRGLAEVFEVDASYFLVGGAGRDQKRQTADMAATLREAGLEGIALRARGLPPEARRMVEQLLDSVREREGLPPVE